MKVSSSEISRLALLAGLVTAVSMPISSPALAQTASTVPGTSASNDTGIQDVVVTARRRRENIEKVPASILALNPTQLRESQVFSESDLQRVAPGLTVRQSNSSVTLNFAIRGQTIDAFTTSPPGVLPYINDVQITSAGPSTFFDLQSIQVLKGPQGTLFGRNTTGGAVLYTTADPTDEFKGSLAARFGNYNRKEIDFMLNVPASDKVLLRLAGNFTQRDGFVTNVANGDDLEAQDNKTIRGSILLKPMDNLKNTTVVQVGQTGGSVNSGALYSLYPVGTPGTSSAATSTYDPIDPLFAQYAAAHPLVDPLGITHYFQTQKAEGPYKVSYNSPTFLHGNAEFVTNTTTYDLNEDYTIKNIAGYAYSRNQYGGDTDVTPYPIFNYGPFNSDIANSYGQNVTTAQYSEELQLQGKAFDGHLSYIVGGYYSHEDDTTNFPQYFFDLSPAFPAGTSTNHNEVISTSEAAFAQGSYDLSDLTGISGLKITGGARYTFVHDDAIQLPGATFYPAPVLGQQFKKPSWTVGFDYQMNPDLLLYVVHRGSWRAGGFNTYKPASYGTAANGGSLFLPETVKDIEVGAKFSGRIDDIPVRLNADAFYEFVENVQRVIYLALATGPTAVTSNVPAAEVKGIEVDGQIKPAPWLTIGGNLSYMYSQFTDNQVTILGATTTFGPYPDTPRFSGDIFAQVELPVPEQIGAVTFRADYYAQSSFYFSSGGDTFDPGTKLPQYGLANFRLNWDGIFGSEFGGSLFINNAFDKTYYVGGLQIGSVFGLNTAIPGQPQMYGAELRYSF